MCVTLVTSSDMLAANTALFSIALVLLKAKVCLATSVYISPLFSII